MPPKMGTPETLAAALRSTPSYLATRRLISATHTLPDTTGLAALLEMLLSNE